MSTGVRFTIADIEALPERLDDTRYEVIDGELLVSSQPHWNHQFVGALLYAALLAWGEEADLGLPNTAPGVIFSPEDAVAPDLIWISHARLAQGLAADGKLHAAPELVVEILSPGSTNEERDRRTKLKLYARRRVNEYWLVDWRARTVEVFRRVGDELAPAGTLSTADTLTSPLLPGFAYPVAALWRRLRP
jgi:Uma2 family endonuclease